MLLRKFHFFQQTNAVDWFVLTLGFICILVCLAAFFLSGGFAFKYNKSKINGNIRTLLLLIHVVGSLVLALALPNNYLNEFHFINDYYTKNGLWIFASTIVLFLLFLLLFGTCFSLLVKLYAKETEDIDKA